MASEALRSVSVLGSRIRARRVALGLSQKVIARKAGIDRGDLSRLEAGKGNPTMARVAKVAAALGVPASDLMREPHRPAA